MEEHEDYAFEEIVNVDDIWSYLTGPFVDALYAQEGESNRPGYVLQARCKLTSPH